jgi:hypothetical protein
MDLPKWWIFCWQNDKTSLAWILAVLGVLRVGPGVGRSPLRDDVGKV